MHGFQIVAQQTRRLVAILDEDIEIAVIVNVAHRHTARRMPLAHFP